MALVAIAGSSSSKPSTGFTDATPTQLTLDGEDEPAPSAAATSPAVAGLSASPSGGFGLVQATSGHPFIWPANGRLVAGMGPAHPGIEIALADSTIVAAARGTVSSVSAGQRESDIEIIIDHENGLQTRYRPVSRALISPGDVVRQGEPIGLGAVADGSVGLLRFEVTIEGAQVDPLDVLPQQGASTSAPATVDCADEAIVIDSGAPLTLDFSASLDPDSVVARASVLNLTGSTSNSTDARASVSGAASVLFETLPSAVNSGGFAYTLIVETRGGGERERLTCTVGVRTRDLEPSPFFLPPTPLPQPPLTGPTSPTATPTGVPPRAPTQAPPAPTNSPAPAPTPTKTPFAG